MFGVSSSRRPRTTRSQPRPPLGVTGSSLLSLQMLAHEDAGTPWPDPWLRPCCLASCLLRPLHRESPLPASTHTKSPSTYLFFFSQMCALPSDSSQTSRKDLYGMVRKAWTPPPERASVNSDSHSPPWENPDSLTPRKDHPSHSKSGGAGPWMPASCTGVSGFKPQLCL